MDQTPGRGGPGRTFIRLDVSRACLSRRRFNSRPYVFGIRDAAQCNQQVATSKRALRSILARLELLRNWPDVPDILLDARHSERGVNAFVFKKAVKSLAEHLRLLDASNCELRPDYRDFAAEAAHGLGQTPNRRSRCRSTMR